MDDERRMKEEMVIEELKKRMKGDMENAMYEDNNLFYRFLKARDFDVDNSETMLRQHLEWRKKYDVKNIFKCKVPEVMKEHFILVMLGYDKEGDILKYNHFGNTDLRGILESCTQEEWLKRLIQYFENDHLEMHAQSEKLGKLVDKVTYIENLENFSLSTATDKKVISNLITAINMYLNNYPETLKTVYVINGKYFYIKFIAKYISQSISDKFHSSFKILIIFICIFFSAPVYFNIFFSVIKVFLPGTVIKKIKVYSDDSWRRDILEAVDAETLPAFLGGERTDPDGNPLCLTLLPEVKPVPKKFYSNKTKKSFPTLKDAETINVSRAAAHELIFKVTKKNSHLEWEFEVKSGDIKFGLFYKNSDNTNTELVPLRKVNTNENTENGLYKCENIGSYIVIFDNSYSFLRSKEIWYKIKVKSPEEHVFS